MDAATHAAKIQELLERERDRYVREGRFIRSSVLSATALTATPATDGRASAAH
jgi:hypothetical protein